MELKLLPGCVAVLARCCQGNDNIIGATVVWTNMDARPSCCFKQFQESFGVVDAMTASVATCWSRSWRPASLDRGDLLVSTMIEPMSRPSLH